MQGSASASSSQNNTDGATARQSKHGRTQTRGAGSNQDRTQKQHRGVETPTEHMNHAESWNGYCHLQTALDQLESVSRRQKKTVKPSKDMASTSVTPSSAAAPSAQSRAMPQPASHNQSMSRGYKVVVVI